MKMRMLVQSLFLLAGCPFPFAWGTAGSDFKPVDGYKDSLDFYSIQVKMPLDETFPLTGKEMCLELDKAARAINPKIPKPLPITARQALKDIAEQQKNFIHDLVLRLKQYKIFYYQEGDIVAQIVYPGGGANIQVDVEFATKNLQTAEVLGKRDSSRDTYLHTLVKDNNIEGINNFIAACDYFSRPGDGRLNIGLATILNATDSDGKTVLIYLLSKKNAQEIIKKILLRGASLNVKDLNKKDQLVWGIKDIRPEYKDEIEKWIVEKYPWGNAGGWHDGEELLAINAFNAVKNMEGFFSHESCDFCFNPSLDPCRLPCGHYFCRVRCLLNAYLQNKLQDEDIRCPTCVGGVDDSKLNTVPTLAPKIIRDILRDQPDRLQVYENALEKRKKPVVPVAGVVLTPAIKAQNEAEGFVYCPRCNQGFGDEAGCHYLKCQNKQCKSATSHDRRSYFCRLCNILCDGDDHDHPPAEAGKVPCDYLTYGYWCWMISCPNCLNQNGLEKGGGHYFYCCFCPNPSNPLEHLRFCRVCNKICGGADTDEIIRCEGLGEFSYCKKCKKKYREDKREDPYCVCKDPDATLKGYPHPKAKPGEAVCDVVKYKTWFCGMPNCPQCRERSIDKGGSRYLHCDKCNINYCCACQRICKDKDPLVAGQPHPKANAGETECDVVTKKNWFCGLRSCRGCWRFFSDAGGDHYLTCDKCARHICRYCNKVCDGGIIIVCACKDARPDYQNRCGVCHKVIGARIKACECLVPTVLKGHPHDGEYGRGPACPVFTNKNWRYGMS